MEWTDERIEELKRLWDKGLSASKIAEAMGGISRNAVIGKAHRLGLAKRPSPIKRPPEGSVPKRRPKPVEPAKPAGATVLDLTDRMCRWPIGHPGDPNFHFCGAKCAPGLPYCEAHAAIAYQPASRSKTQQTG